ncbi:MAG: cytochrome c biogenesis protein CcsA [Acidobacteriota bacterium]|nr:cytochrome c biogenesis protein CcsA [Acidobacteriota bacterium]
MDFLAPLSDHISTLYLPGAMALWSSLFFGLAALWGYTSAISGDPSGIAYGRRAYRFYTMAMSLTAVVFGLLLVRRDFRIEYVFQYSGMDLPMHYQFAAFWAGQKGSFLIWLVFGSLLGLLLLKACGKSEPWVMSIYLLTLFGLVFILIRENPFVMLAESPLDGKGLNPLLQDDWMVIHPPIMFVGYASTAIPFAFAVAALWRKDFSDWAARAFPFALGGFLVLGMAILMGGYWAYKTLGWGGYWGWDPVENASLIPWLLGTVLIHGLHMERTRGRYRKMNLVVACLAFLSVLYGTFLTRSGVLADFSVHSFVDLGISGLLIFMMGFFGLLSFGLLALRLRHVKTQPNEDPIFSRGSFMVLATIAVGLSALVVTVGTSAPLLTTFMEDPGQVGPRFYNQVNTPIALLIAFLLALVPFLTWRGVEGKKLLRQLIPSLAVATVLTVICAIVVVRHPMHLTMVFLASAALTSNLQMAVRKYRLTGLGGAGGYLAHVGVGMMLLGFLASSAYDHSTKVTLEQGVTQEVAGMELTFTRFVPRTTDERERMEVKVQRPNGDVYFAYPKLFVNDRTGQLMANPHIRKLFTADIYISPIEFDPGQPASAVSTMQLAKGDAGTVGDAQVRFVEFDLQVEGNALAQMESGQPATVGAVLEVERGGTTQRLRPLYRFTPDGRVNIEPMPLPGGGQVALTGINATEGGVRLAFAGIGEGTSAAPAKLAVDVTEKPLIKLVWYGLIVILLGGAGATYHRLRQAQMLETIAARTAEAKTKKSVT